jgi:hypothetical protein
MIQEDINFWYEDVIKTMPQGCTGEEKMSTFGIHRLDWLMVSKRFPGNAKYETIYG